MTCRAISFSSKSEQFLFYLPVFIAVKNFLIASMALGLGSVVLSSVLFAFFVPSVAPSVQGKLEELIPAEMPGWKAMKVPLSSTPEGVERVLDVLDLDDVFSREYSKGSTRVMVYAAYWYPGSEPYSSVAIHNPDSCWVIAGWKVEDRESNRKVSFAGLDLKEHEWGIYSKKRTEQHVLFWHLLGGKPNKHIKHMLWTSSGVDSLKRQFYFIYNIAQMGFDLGQDQLFVRISSNKPFGELEKTGELREVFDHLSGLGLTVDPVDSPDLFDLPLEVTGEPTSSHD